MTVVRRSAIVLFIAVTVLFSPAAEAQKRGSATLDAGYDRVRNMNPSEVRSLYRKLPGDLRAELWSAHLLAFLDAHPELDAHQRAVVHEALGLVHTGIFRIDPTSSRWQSHVQAPMDRIITNAKALLPRSLVIEAFFTLSNSAGSGGSRERSTPGIGVDSPAPGSCECSTAFTWCADEARECRTNFFCELEQSYNCGPFFLYACDGMCEF